MIDICLPSAKHPAHTTHLAVDPQGSFLCMPPNAHNTTFPPPINKPSRRNVKSKIPIAGFPSPTTPTNAIQTKTRHSRDLEASRALNVHEERSRTLNKGLQLVLSGLRLGRGVEEIDGQNLKKSEESKLSAQSCEPRSWNQRGVAISDPEQTADIDDI